jgi:MoxR-like ATPase
VTQKTGETFDHGEATVLTEPVGPIELRRRLRTHLKQGRRHQDDPAIMVIGGSGVGKSQIIADLAREMKMEFIDWRLSSMTIVDLVGVPGLNERGRTVFGAPEGWFPDPGVHGVLLVDELSSAPPSTQAQAYQVFREGRVGPHVIPDSWFVLAAANRTNDRGVHFAMPRPLAARFRWYELVPALDDWIAWAGARNYLEPEVYAFLRHSPQWLYAAPADNRTGPWPNPRSWTYVSRTIQRHAHEHRSDREKALNAAKIDIQGEVGPAATVQMYAFTRFFRDLPDPDEIIAGRSIWMPDASRPDVLWATIGAVVTRLPKAEDLDPFLRWCARLPSNFAVLAAMDAARLGKRVQDKMFNSPSWTTWTEQHRDHVAAAIAANS